jgi:hypothetical protein
MIPPTDIIASLSLALSSRVSLVGITSPTELCRFAELGSIWIIWGMGEKSMAHTPFATSIGRNCIIWEHLRYDAIGVIRYVLLPASLIQPTLLQAGDAFEQYGSSSLAYHNYVLPPSSTISTLCKHSYSVSPS